MYLCCDCIRTLGLPMVHTATPPDPMPDGDYCGRCGKYERVGVV